MKEKLLPLGSVIEIRNSKEKYVIIGRKVIKDKKTFDYLCVTYPYGFFQDGDFLYFNEKEVVSLCFLGNINKVGD